MTADLALGLDLDAAIRESRYPDGFPVTFGGTTFTLPSELPIDVFDPLLDPNFDLVGLVRAVMNDESDSIAEGVFKLLTERPDLPLAFRETLYSCLALLFGKDEFEQFKALRPGVPTYARLISGLVRQYGVSVGEAFASPALSESDGATPSPTSPASTPDSTPEASGDAPDSAPATSVSAASAP